MSWLNDEGLIKMSKKKINLRVVMKLLSPSLHHINLEEIYEDTILIKTSEHGSK